MTKRTFSVLGGLALGLGVASGAGASDFDGNQPLLCAPTDVTSCHGAGDCGRMTTKEANLPGFLYLNFEQGKATGRLADGELRESKFSEPKAVDGAIVIQGIARDGTRGFTLRIDDEGDMVLAVAGDDGGLMIQGSCMPARMLERPPEGDED